MRKLWDPEAALECCLLVIFIATAVDIFWSIQTGTELLAFERNPIAAYVIKWGNRSNINGVGLLCALKVLNTYLVVRLCSYLYKVRPRLGGCVTAGITACQLLVIWYLYFGANGK
jgi:hypothetical protein